MDKAIISEEKQKRLDKYAFLKSRFKELMVKGAQKTAVINFIAKEQKTSSATIYKAIK